MHMAWVRYTTGHLKSEYQYSVFIGYNNFSLPQIVTDKQRQSIEEAAQAILDARAKYPAPPRLLIFTIHYPCARICSRYTTSRIHFFTRPFPKRNSPVIVTGWPFRFSYICNLQARLKRKRRSLVHKAVGKTMSSSLLRSFLK
jgi:hypothetical protein